MPKKEEKSVRQGEIRRADINEVESIKEKKKKSAKKKERVKKSCCKILTNEK